MYLYKLAFSLLIHRVWFKSDTGTVTGSRRGRRFSVSARFFSQITYLTCAGHGSGVGKQGSARTSLVPPSKFTFPPVKQEPFSRVQRIRVDLIVTADSSIMFVMYLLLDVILMAFCDLREALLLPTKHGKCHSSTQRTRPIIENDFVIDFLLLNKHM